jgi:NAD(P)-dependent dehydrogenase (short-subunit alcohol dehydrogenase family)
MNDQLAGKIALVTGASKGIGQSLAVGLAEAGATVAVNYKTDLPGATETCERIRRSGGQAEIFQADIGSKSSFEQLNEAVCERLGRLDVLVNNAARTRFGPPEEITEEDFDDVVATILRGPFFGSIAAAACMRRTGGGSIINISSIAVRQIMRFHSSYTMAKGGLESLTRQFAFEFAPQVRVNAIAPTATNNARNLEYDPNFNEKWAKVTPAGRVGEGSDYVGPCVFLAGDQAEFITGQIIYVDGGWSLQGRSPDMSDFDFSSDRQRD